MRNVVLTDSTGGDNIHLALVNQAGNVLAAGQANATNVTEYVEGFTAPTAGTYLAQVSGNDGDQYSLVVTRGGDFQITPASGQLQDLTASHLVLGYSSGEQNLSQTNAVYVRSEAGEPWGTTSNDSAMDAVFGAGNWAPQYYETVNPANLFSGQYNFVFLEGGGGDEGALSAFISANQSAMEQFVASGHTLLINAAPWWSYPTTMNLGFGGVMATEDYATSVSAVDPAAAIFQGPFTPVATTYTGDSFGQAAISGPGLTPLLADGGGNAVLADEQWGSGLVMFGGMTSEDFHAPQPQAMNFLQNVIADTASGMTGSDRYTFQATMGDQLTITANDLGLDNLPNPSLTLFAPSGAQVATSTGDSNSAQLDYTVTSSGVYTVQIQGVNDPGTYLLSVTGNHIPAPPALTVDSTGSDGTTAVVSGTVTASDNLGSHSR